MYMSPCKFGKIKHVTPETSPIGQIWQQLCVGGLRKPMPMRATNLFEPVCSEERGTMAGSCLHS